MVELIISEKPSSAKKIAEALADTKLVKKNEKSSSYYELKHKNKLLLVTSAVGHLYGLTEKEKKGWIYPVFEVKWEPSYKVMKELDYVKGYLDLIQKLAKKAKEFTIACDYDVEGEVIGMNIIRFACNQKDANRMKFSTLTKPDLVEAYETKRKHLDWGQANAGETRHILDWFYGINLSRALTSSVRAAGSFKVMSVGRVQGPALKMLVDREREIEKFVPEPFWEIFLKGEFKRSKLEAEHEKGKIFDQKEAEKIIKKVDKEKEAIVKKVKKSKREHLPPHPFDLTTLQSESYAQFKMTPKETLALAQSLYLAGLTSYPRTSSQQLDPKLGLAKIIQDLGKQSVYELLCRELLKQKVLKPNNGLKTDPAHPAIYPTGLVPKVLKPHEKKVYDLIVKRFLATFGVPAVRETMEVFLDVKEEIFIAKGTRTLEENWYVFYKPYVQLEEAVLPVIGEGDIVTIKVIEKIDKETQPPKRFNQSSIIRELEKRKLGTKATRADILDRLFQRAYIEGVQIKVTKLGMETIKILEKYAPTILDEKLTASFEEEMEDIREGKKKQGTVLAKAKKELIKLLEDFRKKEKVIGKEIIESVRGTQDEQNYIGPCRKCTQGKLMIKFGKFGKFIACSNYPACKNNFKLPHQGLIKNSEKECKECGYPQVQVIQKGKRPRTFCINPNCKTKIDAVEKKEVKELEQSKVQKKCPDCPEGHLVVRKSFYGAFLGCDKYPKCKHTEKLGADKKEKSKEKAKPMKKKTK